MRFQAHLDIPNPVVNVDPIAHPEEVPPESILQVGALDSAENPQRIAVALEAPAAENVTVDVFVVDEGTLPSPNADNPFDATALGKRRFYLLTSALMLHGSALVMLSGPLAGGVYFRTTAGALTAKRVLHVGQIPADII